MKTALVLVMVFLSTMLAAQGGPDEMVVRKIIHEQVAAWNKGDAEAYSRHFAADGTFTNIVGMFFTRHDAFRERHDQIFKGVFRGTTKQEDIVSVRFLRPDVAVAETLQTIAGVQKFLPGTSGDVKGRLRTRLLQVFVKDNGEWKITVYHNVDVKPACLCRSLLRFKNRLLT
jgi:uncharacterized protein (TIGR02246 family)